MPLTSLLILILIFLLTSFVGVVTGSNSLIAVPAMFQFGIEPRVAIATNMFGLVFMGVGGTIPFLNKGVIDMRRTRPLLIVTAVASAIGACLVGLITNSGLRLIVSVAMILVAAFILLRPRLGVEKDAGREKGRLALTLVLTFFLGIYGGLYSGGYVTILTAVLVAFYGLRFSESVAVTKVINVVSSSIATAVFMWQGLVDYRPGIILGVTMFAGGYAGAHFATRMNDIWLKRIFLATVFLLALKTLYDLIY